MNPLLKACLKASNLMLHAREMPTPTSCRAFLEIIHTIKKNHSEEISADDYECLYELEVCLKEDMKDQGE